MPGHLRSFQVRGAFCPVSFVQSLCAVIMSKRELLLKISFQFVALQVNQTTFCVVLKLPVFNDALSFPKSWDNVNVVRLRNFSRLVYTHFPCVVYLLSNVDMIVTSATNRKKVKETQGPRENGDISLYFRPPCVLICPPCVPMCSRVCPGNSCVLV